MSTETHRDRLFEAVTFENVNEALLKASRLEAVGRCISEEPGSGPSSVYFIRDSYGYLFPAKAVMRYAMRLGGFEPKRDNLDFIATDAKAVLGTRHGFDIVEIRENSQQDQFGPRIHNRQKRLAEVSTRPQQAKFRAEIIDSFGGACAVTGNRCLPALQAAHVFPFEHGGSYEVDNGLLLRADIHLLFDFGLMRIDETTTMAEFSDDARNDYGEFSGKFIDHPKASKFLSNLKRRHLFSK